MKPVQLKDRLVKLEAHASHLLDAFIHLRERYAMLDPMLFRASVPERFGKGRRARGYMILRHSLFLSCCQDIAKVVMDNHDQTPSVRRLVDALGNPLVRSELRKRYSVVQPAITDGEPDEGLLELLRRMDEREAKQLGEEFDRHYANLLHVWSTLASSEVIAGFVKIRDKASAHTELTIQDGAYSFFDISTAGVTWGDLRTTIASVQHAVELLGAVIRGAGFAWGMLDEQLARAAGDFWSSDD